MADIPVLLKRSGVKGKLPNPDNAQYGELFVNYHSSDPMLCFKNNAGEIVQLKPARAIDGGGGEMPPNTGNENGDTIWNGSQLLVWDTDEWIPVGPNDLAYEDAADKGTITNTAGSDVELPVATDAAAGLLSGVDKGKLDGVEAGANANVNADWNAVDGDAEILNKPDIPDAQVQSDWAQADSGAVDFIKNKPAIPDEQVQADWDQATSTEPDFIKNKPTDLGDFTNEPGFITDAGVTSIIAGDNISVDTTTGDVTITATGGGGGGASVDVGETPPDPADATEGDLFWSETSGRLYVFAQGAWIDASPDGGSGEGGGGVTSIIAGDGISVDQATGDVTITNTGGGGSGTPGVRYQQGTWTPEVSQGTVTASNSVWVRNGNQVTVWATLTEFSNTSNSAVIEVLGLSLPYSADEALRATTQAVGSCYASFIGRKPTSIALTDSNRLRFSSTAEGGSKTSLSARYQDIGDGAGIRLVATYTTSDTTFVAGDGSEVTEDIQGTGGGGSGGGGGGTVINYNGASAWGNVAYTDANGPCAINGSLNIASVKRVNEGQYQIRFTTSESSANYSVVATPIIDDTGRAGVIPNVINQTTDGFDLLTKYTEVNAGSSATYEYWDVAFSFSVQSANAIAPQSGVGADAYVCVNTSAEISSSFNIENVDPTSDGTFKITFISPMPDNGYGITLGISTREPERTISYSDKSTTGFTVNTESLDGTRVNVGFTATVHASSTITPTYTWTRDGTTLKPANDGDTITTTGVINAGNFSGDAGDTAGTRIHPNGWYGLSREASEPGTTVIWQAYHGTTRTSSITAAGTADFGGNITASGSIRGGDFASGRGFKGENIDSNAYRLGIRALNGVSNSNKGLVLYKGATVAWSVTYGGTASSRNVVLNLEPDNSDNYVSTTNAEGETESVYNGPQLDVRQSILQLQAAMVAINQAAESASNLTSLKTAIKTATADFMEAN